MPYLSARAAARPPFVTLSGNSLRFLLSSVVSLLGDQFTLVAFPWAALKLFGNPALLTASALMMSVPRLAVVLAGGAIADRYSPKVVLMLSDLASASSLFVLGTLLLAGSLTPTYFLAIAMSLSAIGALGIPSGGALLPRIVKRDRLATTNALFLLARQLTTLAGPPAAAVLIQATGNQAGVAYSFWVDAASFLLACLALRFVDVSGADPDRSLSVSPKNFTAAISDAAQGFHAMWRDRQLRALMLYYAVATLFVVGPCQIGFPLLADSRLGSGVSSLATLLTAFSIGTLVGVAVAGIDRLPRLATLGTVILVVDTLCGGALAALGYANSALSGGLLCVGMGFGSGYVQVALVTWIQQRIPLEVLGRTMSVLTFISLVSAPVSVLLIGMLIESFSVPISFAIAGASLALTALTALLSPTMRSIEFVTKHSTAR